MLLENVPVPCSAPVREPMHSSPMVHSYGRKKRTQITSMFSLSKQKEVRRKETSALRGDFVGKKKTLKGQSMILVVTEQSSQAA